jgi:hypothetical protein
VQEGQPPIPFHVWESSEKKSTSTSLQLGSWHVLVNALIIILSYATKRSDNSQNMTLQVTYQKSSRSMYIPGLFIMLGIFYWVSEANHQLINIMCTTSTMHFYWNVSFSVWLCNARLDACSHYTLLNWVIDKIG